MLTGGPAVVLVRPQLAVNIGMCARAMANFGLDDLRLVNPRAGWPRVDDYREVAYSAAAGATHLLDAAKVFDSVEAAVGDLHYLYASTARERGQVAAPLRLGAAGEEHQAGRGHVQPVHGQRIGMDDLQPSRQVVLPGRTATRHGQQSGRLVHHEQRRFDMDEMDRRGHRR